MPSTVLPAGLRPTTRSNRLLAVATVQTAVVAALAGAVGVLTDTAPLLVTGSPVHVRASGPAGAATTRTLQGLLLVAVALPIVVPVAVGASRARRGGDRWPVPLGRVAAAVAGVPAVLAALWLAVVARAWLDALGLVAAWLGLVAAWLGLVAGVHLLASRWGPSTEEGRRSDADARPPDDAHPQDADGRSPDDTGPATALIAAVAGLVLLVGVLGVPAVAPGQAGALVESERVYTPYVDWAFDYEPTGDGRGVLTVTHRGGDAVEAGRVSVEGTGFADVPGADQTVPGRWRGTRDSAGNVAAADSVTVGVRADCHVRVVFADLVAIGEYTCPGGR